MLCVVFQHASTEKGWYSGDSQSGFSYRQLVIIRHILPCSGTGADLWWSGSSAVEMECTVCCPAPVSNSRSGPILWPAAATRFRHRPTARVEPGGRCGRRDSRAVEIQMGSTGELQHTGSSHLPPLTVDVWPAAAVATGHFQRASSSSSWGRCRLTPGCCYSTHLLNDLKIKKKDIQ